jgi:hypothetical protein
MSISASTAVSVNSTIQSTGNTSTRSVRHDRGEHEGENRRVGGERGRQQFANAVTSALSALGLSLPAQTAPANSTTAPASSGTTPATATTAPASTQSVDSNANKSDVQQALHGFMHSLYQALRSGENRRSEGGREGERENEGASREVGQGRDSYRNDLASRVQNLVQNLSAEGTGSSKIDNLKTAFTNLVQALQAGNTSSPPATTPAPTTDTTTPAKAPDLQAFLQNFLKNLQGGSTPVSPVGGTVNTVV